MYPPSDASEEPAERGGDIVNIRRTVDECMVMCIRVPKKEGETVRSALAESGILRSDHRIKAEGGFLLMPVSSDPGGWELTEADLEPQEAAEKDYRALSEVPAELRHLLPGSYDIIGDVAIIKLEEELLPYRHSVGGALLRVSSNLRTVMLDSGVKGEFRVRDLERIAGSGTSETVHREFGLRMATDPAKVYFNPRLATERMRIARLVKEGEIVIDMFAGVAPFPLVICRHARPGRVYAIDLNPAAREFALRNIEMNRIDRIEYITGDAREVIGGLPQADRIVMNLPQMAYSFLPDALARTRTGGTVHMHAILERTEAGAFADSLLEGIPHPARLDRVSELKTYSPTMSVYVLDIVRC